MKQFRASYSTLAAWARGDYDLALGMYFKTATFDNDAMRLGRALHDEWEQEIKASGCMPQVFGAKPLPKGYKCEVFATRKLADWLVLRGKLDLHTPTPYASNKLKFGENVEGEPGRVYDYVDARGVGFDWKSGVTPSTQWANSMQHKVYQVLYPSLQRFEYHAFNPYAKRSQAVTVSIVHLTPKTLEEGVEWLVTHAGEMKHYIEQNDLEATFAKIPGARV